MLQQRRSRIIERIQQEKMVKVVDLMEEFGVSIETIRRDLEYLERKAYLKRVYGGAVLNGLETQEPTYERREVIHYEEKRAIALRAAQLIEDGDTIFVDVGTTALEVVHALSGKRGLTVITNATLAAQAASRLEDSRVILLGGELRGGDLSVSGSLCDGNLDNFYANKAILGAGGVSVQSGITDYHLAEASSRRLMIAHSDQVMVVCDYSKFGVVAMNRVCSVSDIHTLVTDWSIPSKVEAEFHAKGVNVIVAAKA